MIEIKAAYGRKYLTMDDALEAWNKGLDFKIVNGPYCSYRDLDRMVEDYDRVVLINGTERHTLKTNIWGAII